MDDFITNSEKELIYFREILTHNLNKENLKKISRDVVVDYLKKTLCDLIDQKKDQLSSFLDSSDYFNYIHRYNKSLEKILSSRENSIKYLQSNSTSLKNTTKDQMIHNILNVKNQSNDVILNQKIKNFKENFHKEFSKNNFYIHNILSTIMNDVVYHSNIALMNSIKECLREDFGLLDKISEPINLPGIQNFQNNGIQTSYLLTQNFMRNKNQAFESENGEKKPGHTALGATAALGSNTANAVGLINNGLNMGAGNAHLGNNTGNIISANNNTNSHSTVGVGISGLNNNINLNNANNNVVNLNNTGISNVNNSNSGIDFVIGSGNKHLNSMNTLNNSFNNLNLSGLDNYTHFSHQHCFQNSMIKDSFFIQIIGLKISAHPDALRLSQELKEHFKCPKVSIIKLNDNQSYGTRVFLETEEYMNKIMNSNKSHKVVLDNKLVKLKKKQAKEGNRLYAIYLDSVGKKGK